MRTWVSLGGSRRVPSEQSSILPSRFVFQLTPPPVRVSPIFFFEIPLNRQFSKPKITQPLQWRLLGRRARLAPRQRALRRRTPDHSPVPMPTEFSPTPMTVVRTTPAPTAALSFRYIYPNSFLHRSNSLIWFSSLESAQLCPPGTVFNPPITSCDFPFNVPGCENGRRSMLRSWV